MPCTSASNSFWPFTASAPCAASCLLAATLPDLSRLFWHSPTGLFSSPFFSWQRSCFLAFCFSLGNVRRAIDGCSPSAPIAARAGCFFFTTGARRRAWSEKCLLGTGYEARHLYSSQSILIHTTSTTADDLVSVQPQPLRRPPFMQGNMPVHSRALHIMRAFTSLLMRPVHTICGVGFTMRVVAQIGIGSTTA